MLKTASGSKRGDLVESRFPSLLSSVSPSIAHWVPGPAERLSEGDAKRGKVGNVPSV